VKLNFLKKHYAFFQRHGSTIVSKWVTLPSVTRNLSKLEISSARFQSRYAIHIYKYFLSVINGTNSIGNCPAMKEFVSLMVEKEIQPRDAFMICLGLKTVATQAIHKSLSEDRLQTLTQLYRLLDANFSGVLELFTELFLLKKQEQKMLRFERDSLLKVQTALDIQENFTLLVDSEFNVTLANRSFLDIYALKDVKHLNVKYPQLSFIEYFIDENGKSRYRNEQLSQTFQKVEDTEKISVRLNFIPYLYKLKVRKISDDEFVVTLSDISEYDEELKRLRHKVYVDVQTKTYNAIKFEEELKRFLSLRKELVEKVCVVTASIDELNFYKVDYDTKIVEDLIVKTAYFLKTRLRYVEMLARVGEGRFAFIIYGKGSKELQEIVNDLNDRYQKEKFFINARPTLSWAIVTLRYDDGVATVQKRTDAILNEITNLGGNLMQDDTLEYEKQQHLKQSNNELVKRLESLPKDSKLKAAFLYGELLVYFTLVPDKKIFNGFRFMLKEDVNVLADKIYFELHNSDVTVCAEVFEFDKKSNTIVLKNFLTETEFSPLQREYVHVTPKEKLAVDIEAKNYYAKGFIRWLSEKSLEIYVKDIGRLKNSCALKVKFEIQVEHRLHGVETDAQIDTIQREKDFYKLTLNYVSPMDKDDPLIKFIYARQLEIIRDYHSHL
jgi:GGDEF domain-containing protein